MPKKSEKISIKNSVQEASGTTEEEPEGCHPLPGGQVARPHPWPRHQGAWVVGPTSGAPFGLFLPLAQKPSRRIPQREIPLCSVVVALPRSGAPEDLFPTP